MHIIKRIFGVSLRHIAVALLGATLIGPVGALAQSNPFEKGWTLQNGASSLSFQSVKNMTKVESSGFATFSGQIAPDGETRIAIQLESVDTKVDLRNVRMRFLLFETFQFPEAIITARLDPASLADLAQMRRKQVPLSYTLDLHGVKKTFTTEVIVTLLSDDLVAVSSGTPISVAVDDFALTDGLKKLEEAANVAIVPSATVSFDFMFARNQGAATTPAAPVPATSAALEPEGNFDLEACKGRFEILSRTGNIYFAAGSARLDDKSAPLLNSLIDIISRCPGLLIEVGGHTDSDGSDATNQRLSEARANAVTRFILARGIDAGRIVSKGYGETMPAFANDTPEHKSRNRRIEFAVKND